MPTTSGISAVRSRRSRARTQRASATPSRRAARAPGSIGHGRRRRCPDTCTSSPAAPSGSYREGTMSTHDAGHDVERDAGRGLTEPQGPPFRWLERGAGEAVILLHGLMGQMQHWDAVLERLEGGYRAIALELPIFHCDLREPSLDALARHVVRFMDALDIPHAVVGGNSL